MTDARDKTVMVLRVIGDCGTKGGRDKVGFYLVPAIITNQGEEFKELTQERRTLWISAIDHADLKAKSVLLSSLCLWQASRKQGQV